MNENGPLPPGGHPHDPFKTDIDPIAFALAKVQTYLLWIDEHRASFESSRDARPNYAASELRYLEDSTTQALIHLQRLKELLLAGYAIDPKKRIPKGLTDAPRLESFLKNAQNLSGDDLVPQVSEEELDRREAANEKRYTTAEVLAHLDRTE